jgi:endonuclease-8
VPEGDTIFKAARALHGAFAGATVTGFTSVVPAVAAAARRLGIVGRVVEAVEPRGKHLLVRFAGGPVLHTHLRMTGSWRLVPREGAARAPMLARVVIETAAFRAVCSFAPVVELLSAREAARHPALRSLGEDVLASAFDPDRARAALRARTEVEIGVALLDQTALSGLGNVYKNEVLFLCGLSPFRPVKALTDEELDRVIATARAQMQKNLGPGPRRTTTPFAADRHWVYGRGGRPCRRCGTGIVRRRQGEHARSTWFCPRCQPGPEGGLRAGARPR